MYLYVYFYQLLILVRYFSFLHFPPRLFSPSFSGPAFSTPAFWSFIFRSCIFHPRYLVRHFSVLLLPPLLFSPSFSGPAFSFYCSYLVRQFQVLHFQSTHWKYNCSLFSMNRLNWQEVNSAINLAHFCLAVA